MWDRELVKHLADKPFQLDQLQDHNQQQQQQDQREKNNDWSIQLQQSLSENEKNKKNKKKKQLETNNEFHQSFENMILKKLVALLLEKHFALAASDQLKWQQKRGRSLEKLRKRSSSTRRLEAKNFLTTFEENSLTAKNFGQTASGHFAPAPSKTAA